MAGPKAAEGLVNGCPALSRWRPTANDRLPRSTSSAGKIAAIYMVRNPDKLGDAARVRRAGVRRMTGQI